MFHPRGPTLLELAQQALSSTERGYDLLAPKFDFTPFRTPEPVVEAMAREIGGPRSIEAALDLCCGTGAVLAHLAPLCRERVVGVDFSGGMLEVARQRIGTMPGPAKVELVRGDVLALGYDEDFDVVTCAGSFGHILPRDEDRFIGSVARALRPGGRFVFPTGEVPPLRSPWRWAARAFNGVMRLRNALLQPPFVMYYLTFVWPEVRRKLERWGLHVEPRFGACPPPFQRVILVNAARRRPQSGSAGVGEVQRLGWVCVSGKSQTCERTEGVESLAR